MLDANDPTVRSAVFGKQVQDFIETELGAYIVKRAETQANRANEKLKTCAAWRTRRIRDLQNQIAVAESIIVWLADAINSGQQATDILKDIHE
jgi:hypothetical protein